MTGEVKEFESNEDQTGEAPYVPKVYAPFCTSISDRRNGRSGNKQIIAGKRADIGGDGMSKMKELREQAEEYWQEHIAACEDWTHGEVETAWLDDDGNTCVQYKDGSWWHYKETPEGLQWW